MITGTMHFRRITGLSLFAVWFVYAVSMILLVIFVQLTKVWPANPLFTFTSAVFFLFSLGHALMCLGLRRGIGLFALVFSISLAFETINLLSGGLVFGPLLYTHKLGFKLFDLVPILIPLTWFTVGYLSFRIAGRIVGERPGNTRARLRLAAVAALIMVAWDLGLDPAMVAKGHWLWLVPGSYFGIPLHNFLGWWLTAFSFCYAFLLLEPTGIDSGFQPARGTANLLASSAYCIMCISMSIANADMGKTGPAIIGFLAMGSFGVYWLRDSWHLRHSHIAP
jgi:uncharacterized membrane protein